MSTQCLHRLELLVAALMFGCLAFWIGEVSISALGGMTIGPIKIGQRMLAISIPPIQLTIFLQEAVNAIFFCAVMWQIRMLFKQARSERKLLRGLEMLLARIAWLILIWPFAGLVAAHVGHVMWGQESLSWECPFSFSTVSFMLVGVALLVLGSTVKRLRRTYEEMQLVV